ncbi:MAG: PAS domain-containing sensor histidine kinase, partial [Thermoplasmata archaeon]
MDKEVSNEDIIQGVFETAREPLLILDSSLHVVAANASFYTTFQVTPEETLGNFIYDLGNCQWDIPKLRELLEKILPQNTSFDNFEVSHRFPEMGEKIMVLNARRLKGKGGKTSMILLAIE